MAPASSYSAPFFATVIIGIGYRTLWHGLQALSRLNFRSINLLMVIAVAGAFYLGQYEEAAVVIVLFALGERLEEYGIAASKSALQALVDRTPKTATVKDANGTSREVPLAEIRVGETLIIKPSDMIAMDAEVTAGSSSVDESTITGEPLPKDKHEGDTVFAGTLNMQGYLEARVAKEVKDSTLSKIIDVTFAATKTKAETQKFIEKFSAYYTPSIILIAALLVIVPVLILGQPFESWFREALTLLVIACPCALVKGGKYIEALGRVRVVAMDKTRTLTYGKPKVTDILPFGESSREHLLACAAGIESYSEHPLAQAIVDAAGRENIPLHGAKNFEAVLGKGAKADCVVCYDTHHCIGKLRFITEEHAVQQEVVARVEALQREGKTSIVVSNGDGVEGIIALTDELKPESKAAVAELARLGVKTVMLTGDNQAPAEAVAREVGIREVRAELLPEDKATAIRELTVKYGAVAIVGDGVNDAPALALSSVGVAMGAAGSDTAIEAASVAILNDRLELIPYLIRLGRRAILTIKINTTLAVVTKLVFVGLAIAGLSSLALAILADVGVTVIVILNSLRLLRFEKLLGNPAQVILLPGLLIAASVLAAHPSRRPGVRAQQQAQPARPVSTSGAPVRTGGEGPVIVNTDLVSITVAVTDRGGRHFNGLDKDAFSLYDDNVLQEISFFSDADTPISFAIIFDTSGSMSGDKIMRASEALAGFVETTHREDEYFLISFSDRARLLLDGTGDADAVLNKFTYAQPHGETALYDATYLGIEKVTGGTRARRAVLLITDGNDTCSRYTFKELRRSLQEADAILYAVGILGTSRFEARVGRRALKELASVSGGQAFFPNDAAALNEAFERIALDLRSQYSIGYRPTDLTRKVKWHRLKINVTSLNRPQRLLVRNREGFYAPR